jgi:ABC-type antimicrobial peptide transport system permease subunit
VNVTAIMNDSFNVIIVITMILCFFALTANMSANILNQTKELAVLRAIGVRKHRVVALYFYEAMALVLASSLSGILIGFLVAFTMALQQSLMTGSKIPIIFPWVQLLVILALTFVCAFCSTVGPSYQLMKK